MDSAAQYTDVKKSSVHNSESLYSAEHSRVTRPSADNQVTGALLVVTGNWCVRGTISSGNISYSSLLAGRDCPQD